MLFLHWYRGSVLGSWQTSRTQDSGVSFLGWLAELPWTADNALLTPSLLPLRGWNRLDPPESQPKEKESGWVFSHVSPANAGAISRARLRERGETSDPGCRSFSFPAVRSLRQAARNVPFSGFDPLSQNTSREGPGTGRGGLLSVTHGVGLREGISAVWLKAELPSAAMLKPFLASSWLPVFKKRLGT